MMQPGPVGPSAGPRETRPIPAKAALELVGWLVSAHTIGSISSSSPSMTRCHDRASSSLRKIAERAYSGRRQDPGEWSAVAISMVGLAPARSGGRKIKSWK